MDTVQISLPPDLLPKDPRFGSGPSRVRTAQLQSIKTAGIMGTSHRQPPVKNIVGDIREKLSALLNAPADYEIILGNGGATAFWAAATASLVKRQAAHAVFGEFGSKFAQETNRAPFLQASIISEAPAGQLAQISPHEEADIYAWPQNETSTGVCAPIRRVDLPGQDALTLIDATSIAGATPVDLTQCDVYYFSPQKCFGSDGGLWLALVSPRALARIEEITTRSAVAGRWIPEFLDLSIAAANSRKNQTLNTPALATLIMLHSQLAWLLDNGGMEFSATRSKTASDHVYSWATQRPWATPFVTNEKWRSPVVATIDFIGVDATNIANVLRQNGIVDIDPYRKLGRNQLRIATFPAVGLADTRALTNCIDYVVQTLTPTPRSE